jgi:2-iminobutanoate/2-iminopropanoate deaminase
MTTKNSIVYSNPETMNKPGGHYSHGVLAGGMLFIAGQLPIEADGKKLADQSFEVQAKQTLANIGAVLTANSLSVHHLVQVRVYVTDIGNWPAFNQLYAAWAGEAKPARAVVPVPALHYGFLLEIEAVAAL